MQKIILASNNQGKVREFKELFAPNDWQIIPQSDYQISSIPETGLTFVENALLKARHASKLTNLPAIADDSGLVVDALHGAPGIYSARYAGENADSAANIKKLLRELEGVADDQRGAQFYCVLVYLRFAEDPAPIIAQASWQGKILFQSQGVQGFGYDPVFWVPTHNCSAAELPPAIKNKISHRGQALEMLLREI